MYLLAIGKCSITRVFNVSPNFKPPIKETQKVRYIFEDDFLLGEEDVLVHMTFRDPLRTSHSHPLVRIFQKL